MGVVGFRFVRGRYESRELSEEVGRSLHGRRELELAYSVPEIRDGLVGERREDDLARRHLGERAREDEEGVLLEPVAGDGPGHVEKAPRLHFGRVAKADGGVLL